MSGQRASVVLDFYPELHVPLRRGDVLRVVQVSWLRPARIDRDSDVSTLEPSEFLIVNPVRVAMRHDHRMAALVRQLSRFSDARSVRPEGVAEIAEDPRLVERDPVLDSISELPKADAGVVAKV